MSFSFSVGDFVACLTLIKDISDALNNSTGSEADFKALFATLKSLENAFKICQLVYQQCEEPYVQPEVQMQARTIRQALLDEHQRCRNILEAFVASLGSYTAAFVDDGSKAMALARHMRKITWPSRKADVANLERNLRGHLNSLQMYAAALFQLYLAANTKIVTSTESKVDSILANVTDLRAEVTTIFAGVQISNSRRLRGVGNIWEGASGQLDIVILNDPIGRTVPLPIMLLSSRTALHNMVLWMFHDRDIPGRAKVRRKEYTITDEDADGILIEEANWDMIYHPGKHLSLNMVFPALPSWNVHRCPRCDRPAIGKARPGERRHW
ncbi:hypothetical protein F5882DRAFT_180455 [Hyaloscypha sp. PMI_1271]|nr:hypothetical protein F5882DRAFT_180455 [Hyaloscypha sp. PMI_1271]